MLLLQNEQLLSLLTPCVVKAPLSANFWLRLIGQFRVHLRLHFKARLSAKLLLWKSVFIHIEIGSNYHNKNFALRLALKERLTRTRKWPICLLYLVPWEKSHYLVFGVTPTGATERIWEDFAITKLISFFAFFSNSYRKIPGDTCVDGTEADYMPVLTPCPIQGY